MMVKILLKPSLYVYVVRIQRTLEILSVDMIVKYITRASDLVFIIMHQESFRRVIEVLVLTHRQEVFHLLMREGVLLREILEV